MQPNEPLFAASLATACGFLLYYLVRNTLHAVVFKRYPRSAGTFETFAIMGVIVAPCIIGLAPTDSGRSAFANISAYYFAFVFVIVFISYVITTKFPIKDDSVVESINYVYHATTHVMTKDFMSLRVIDLGDGRYGVELGIPPNANDLPKNVSAKIALVVCGQSK